MKEWNLRFSNPGESFDDDGNTFGVTVSNYAPPSGHIQLTGTVFSGAYDSVLHQVSAFYSDETPATAIILLKQNKNHMDFLDRLGLLCPGCHCVGGTAAGTEQLEPRVYPANGDVSVLFLDRRAKAEKVNFHDAIEEVHFTQKDGVVDTINNVSALGYLQQIANDKNDGLLNLEQITLSDCNGKNVHFDIRPCGLYPNASLGTGDMATLRFLNRATFRQKFSDFIATPNSIVFGCAGLGSLIDFDYAMPDSSMIGFFHGEVITLEQPCFANLMMTKLIFD